MNRGRIVAIALCLAASAVGMLAYGLAAPQATLLGPALVRLPPAPGGAREVSLTFDDGPSPYTAKILDVLKANRIHAAFFLCGENSERYPELVRRIQAEGHQIGNHTYSHPYLYLSGRESIASEIDRTQDTLERILGRRPRLFRPPYGVRWFSLWPLLRERGMTLVLWSVRGYDGRLAPQGIAGEILARVRPGAIILLHDGFEARPSSQVDRQATVDALPVVIAGLRKAGYAFSPVPD